MILKTTVAVFVSVMCWTAVPAKAQTSYDQRARMGDFVNMLLVEKKVRQAYEKYADSRMIQRNPAMGKDRESTIQFLEKMLSNPEARFAVTDIYVDGAVTIASYSGQLGAGSPGARVVEFFRWKDGKIVEHWDVFQVIQ